MSGEARAASRQGIRTPRAAEPRRVAVAGSARRAAPAPARRPPQEDLLAREEEYRRLNAELEAKTTELVRQAEEVMRGQNEVLSKPASTHLSLDTVDDHEEFGEITATEKPPTARAKAGKPQKPPSNHKIPQRKKATLVDDVAVPEDFGDFSLAQTISSIEGRVSTNFTDEHVDEDVIPNNGQEMGAEAQIRFLKAKLRVMQEELNRILIECVMKDDENGELCSKLKEAEEDRARLQRTTAMQQAQLEKHRGLVEEANKNCDGLRQQAATLQKDLESIKRAQKQSASTHSATEVRLNRALEEAEKNKAELCKLKQSTKDCSILEQQRTEALQAENKKLERQKAELILGFKKQLKLIDILKRQKMHFEAARMLSFTEEEFIKALDWGKS